MANTTVASELVVKKFLSDFFREYIRTNRFARYTGTSNNNVITIKEGRQQIEVPLVTRLKGDGVSGSSTLRGNGESIGNYGLTLTPTYYRHAVEFDKEEMEKPNIDLMRAARPLLMDWAKELIRDQQIEAFGAIYDGTTYANYGDSAAAANDTYQTNNDDRLLFGALTSNLAAGDFTASLATLDNTADKLTDVVGSLAKRLAQQADPHIRPIRNNADDEEYFVMFCDPYAFRDLASSSAMATANRDARERGVNNPVFTGGDLLKDGVIYREIPEIANFIDGTTGTNGLWGGAATADGFNTAGAGSIRVAPNFLCGQQALSFGLGQRPQVIVDKLFDYEFQPGVAVELKQEIRKSYFNNVQHGVVTVFTAAVKD
jgi:hypothetical protein